MPKFTRRWRWPAWLGLAILTFVPAYLFLQHPVGTSIVLAVLFILTIVERIRYKARLRRLAGSRAGESICEFARSFERHQVDTWVVCAVYEQLQEYLGGNPPVPIRAADRLKVDLPVDTEELEMDIVARIAQRTGRSLTTPLRICTIQRSRPLGTWYCSSMRSRKLRRILTNWMPQSRR